MFLSIFRGTPDMPVLEQSIWNTYTFSEGDLERNRQRMERGILPWWAVDAWKVDMWRPLPSLSHWLDFWLFGENPLPMHVHSVLLYGLVCLAVGLLFRSLLGRAALFASLLFAVDAAHGMTVGWLSNRHALYMTMFSVLSLLAHHQARRRADWTRPWGAWGTYGVLSVVFLALALFSSEGAVGLGGYFLAYALFLDPLARTRRDGHPCAFNPTGALRAIVTLLPQLAAVVVWRAIYTGLGHGTLGSWLYTDPLKEPAAFLYNFPVYYPLSLFGLFGTPDCALWLGVPAAYRAPCLSFVIVYLALMAWGLYAVLRDRAGARFLALGCAIALIPTCSTLPADRNLMLASVGAVGLIGVALRWYWDLPLPRRRYLPRRLFIAVCVLVHIVLSPLLLPGASYMVALMDRGFRHVNESAVPADPGRGTRYVVLNTPLDYLGASLPVFRAATGQAQPTRWWWLCAGPEPVEVERLDEHRIALRPRGGFLPRPFGQIFRWPEGYPMAVGDEVRLDGMAAQVIATRDDGRPIEVQFTFDRPLDSPDFQWVTWSQGEYIPTGLPPVGQTMVVAGLDRGAIARRILQTLAPGSMAAAKTGGQTD